MKSDMFKQDYDITHLTTFGIPAKARLFAEYGSVKELTKISRTPEFLENEVLHIGGGSNLLFVNDFDGLILHSGIKGIERYDKDSATAFVIAGAGEKWTELVDWCIAQGLAGLENLAGIPGEVGASAVQNVGAYGVEAKDVIHAVECFDTEARKTIRLTAEQCRFGYRDSIFKHEAKGRYFVLRVSFRLRPSTEAEVLGYGPLKDFEQRLGHHPSIAEVKREVESIRASKLPDPKCIGSAGSFFKNPVVSKAFYEGEVLRRDSDVPCFELPDGNVKISAAWLIDHAGLKGKRTGGAKVYPSQPLVIANINEATASDVCRLSKTVVNEVNRRFGIRLRPEVNFIDSSVQITVLGSGTSKGIPEIGCSCEVCSSKDLKDKRFRSSVYVRTHGLDILIDSSPGMRIQALTNDIDNVDAVLITHNHTDHVGGIDDLRPFCHSGAIPVYLKKDVADSLRVRYDYCFKEHAYPGVPSLELKETGLEPFHIEGLKIIPIGVRHGKLPILGYRIGKFAYITDAKTIDESEKEKLNGVEVLIVNALRDRDHFAHFTIGEAIKLIEEIKPKRAYLTHICHEAGTHKELSERMEKESDRLGIEIRPAFDGQHIDIK